LAWHKNTSSKQKNCTHVMHCTYKIKQTSSICANTCVYITIYKLHFLHILTLVCAEFQMRYFKNFKNSNTNILSCVQCTRDLRRKDESACVWTYFSTWLFELGLLFINAVHLDKTRKKATGNIRAYSSLQFQKYCYSFLNILTVFYNLCFTENIPFVKD